MIDNLVKGMLFKTDARQQDVSILASDWQAAHMPANEKPGKS